MPRFSIFAQAFRCEARLRWPLFCLLGLFLGTAPALADVISEAIAEPGAIETQATPGYSAQIILESIGTLEAERDAKCNSTASRFEDFLFGTPLSDAARIEKTRLQKALVRMLWFKASAVARKSGAAAVTAVSMEEQSVQVVRSQESTNGNLKLSFRGRPPLAISARRNEQYGSIAFSLRAILAVQQEFLLSSERSPLALTPRATRVLQETIDLVTLASLMTADEASRAANEFEVGAGRLRDAWLSLVPEPVRGPGGSDSGAAFADSYQANPAEKFLLDEMIDQKIAAYRTYNDLSERKTRALFVTNTVRFYARAKIARNGPARSKIIAGVNLQLDVFTQQLVAAAEKAARGRGHLLVRADDAGDAAARLLPQEIDEFEDVHVFPNSPPQERVLLESYDCDSFRDFGAHWLSLKRVLAKRPESALSLDPFAAEIVAETISQYGVLLLRVAGGLVNERKENLLLGPGDLSVGASLIVQRAKNHPEEAPTAPKATGIVSSPGTASSETSGLFFTDITDAVGLDFEHRSSKWLGEFRHKQVKTPPTFSGGGIAAEDIDGDGNTDLLLVGGAGNALLMNTGEGDFADITVAAGLETRQQDGSFGEPRQPIIADFDNDGFPDILITYVDDDHRLYRNLGDRRFVDVTETSGLGGAGLIGGPATAFDFDRDGMLDLYVGYFGDYLQGDIPAQERDNHEALPNRLFRNLGGLRFEDVTEKSGTGDRGWTQAVSHMDFDGDGWQDIVVANDYGLNAFFRNRGNGQFEDLAAKLGMSKALHSMNVGVTDINADGFPDIYISNIATLVKDNKYTFPDVNTPLDFDLKSMSGMLVKEADTFLVSLDTDGQFSGYTVSEDVERGSTSTGWAWDAEFFDFDHDGDDDLYLVNGTNDYNAFSMIYRNQSEGKDTGAVLLSHSRESNVFFLNEEARLKNRSGKSGADFTGNSRSTAYFDFDSDGDLDIAVNNFHGRATLLRNNSEEHGRHWLKIKLVGDPEKGSSRDAIGARIDVSVGETLKNSRIVQGGSGYLSMNPKQQHFGLADAEFADLRIVWPNGEEQEFARVATNHAYTIYQGASIKRADVSGQVSSQAPPDSVGGSD